VNGPFFLGPEPVAEHPLANLVMAVAVAALATEAFAQPTVRLPDTAPSVNPSGVFPPSTPGAAAPSTSPSTLGTPAFDPYGNSAGAASLAPSLTAPPSYTTPPSPYGTPLPSGISAPPGAAPGYPGAPGGSVTGATPNPYGQPYGVYPPGMDPASSPPSLFPGGTNPVPWTVPTMPAMRFLTPRVRYTWVDSNNNYDSLGINDFDFSVVAAFPNFLFSTQPLYVAPSFSLHLWSGPREPAGDLPPNAYSAFLDFGWSSDPTKPFGGEIGVRPGVFTDFKTFDTNSLRIMGQGLFRIQTTPTTSVRAGVVYIDRNDLKLLPAFGLLWTPNAQTRFDVFFPHPKLAQHLTTMGNQDLWWYVAGEYGGGAWTVERGSEGATFSDRIDINDIRVMLGVEWGQSALLQQGRRTGFVEVGWVTDREVVYVVTPSETSSLRDSWMVRAGWNY
jgi:hypothetical protein